MKLHVIDLVERKMHGVEETELPVDMIHDELLRMWNESPDGPQGFAVVEDSGRPLFVILRNEDTPQIAHVMFANGNRYDYRCDLVTDQDGQYERTDVVALKVAHFDEVTVKEIEASMREEK